MLLRCCYGAVTVVFFLKKKLYSFKKILKNIIRDIKILKMPWRKFGGCLFLRRNWHLLYMMEYICMLAGIYTSIRCMTLFCMHVGLRDLMLALNMHWTKIKIGVRVWKPTWLKRWKQRKIKSFGLFPRNAVYRADVWFGAAYRAAREFTFYITEAIFITTKFIEENLCVIIPAPPIS